MNPFEVIKEKAEKYQELRVVQKASFITVSSKNGNGFDVTFSDDGDEYTVSYDGWHQHFDKGDVESALNCFVFGLSDSCRIKVISRGGKDYKWVLESKEKW